MVCGWRERGGGGGGGRVFVMVARCGLPVTKVGS